MDLGDRLKEIRRKCLLSQSEFAEELGISFSTVNRWENNKSTPNYQTLKKIRDFCEKKGIPFEVDNEIWEEIDESN